MATADISAQNQFTDPVLVDGYDFDVSIHNSSSFVGTITLQRSREKDGTYRDVETWTAVVEDRGVSAGKFWYRLGCKTGDYTSGTISLDIST